MDWSAALGLIGLGALLKSGVDFFLSRKSARTDLQYKEKREAYLGLLDALHKAAIEPSDINSKNFALWQSRVQLFGSPDVAEAVQGIIDTNDGPREKREEFFSKMLKCMKADLSS
nr:hypothetical protein [uncultured Deefgea sp.]